MRPGFVPISLRDYLDKHMKANPRDDRADVAARLESAAQAYREGHRCDCGEPIWIIGSAIAGSACFTCITGSACPDKDYELDIAFEQGTGSRGK